MDCQRYLSPARVSEIALVQMKIGIFKFYFSRRLRSHRAVRNALTGFRTGWQHLKAAVVPSTSDVSSDLEPRVNRLDYAADGSEDDEKEGTSASLKKPDNDPSKVC